MTAPWRRSVLVVEHDSALARFIVRPLQLAGFEVVVVGTSAAAQEQVERQQPSIVLLEADGPDGSGFDLAVKLRAIGRAVGLLFVADGDSLEARLNGFAAGADDVVPRPFRVFRVPELVARVGALHRRMTYHQASTPLVSGSGGLIVKGFAMNPLSHELVRDERGSGLTATELRVLRHLMSNVDRVVTKAELMAGVWGDQTPRSPNSAEKFVSQVRRKLSATGDPLIETVRGVGYIVRSV